VELSGIGGARGREGIRPGGFFGARGQGKKKGKGCSEVKGEARQREGDESLCENKSTLSSAKKRAEFVEDKELLLGERQEKRKKGNGKLTYRGLVERSGMSLIQGQRRILSSGGRQRSPTTKREKRRKVKSEETMGRPLRNITAHNQKTKAYKGCDMRCQGLKGAPAAAARRRPTEKSRRRSNENKGGKKKESTARRCADSRKTSRLMHHHPPPPTFTSAAWIANTTKKNPS